MQHVMEKVTVIAGAAAVLLLLVLGFSGTRAMQHVRGWDAAGAAVGLFLFSVAAQRFSGNGRRRPIMWPVFGILPSLFYYKGDVYEWMTRSLNAAGGTFPYRGMWLAGCHGVITVDPANIEYMLKTNFPNYPKGTYYRERFADLLGDGIFNADDHLWREQRRAATAEMHSSRFLSHSADTITALVHRRLLPLLNKLVEASAAVDLQDVFLRFTFDNICTAAFGVDAGCLAIDLPTVAFAKAFEEATEYSLFRFTVPHYIWKPMKALNIGTERHLKSAVEVVHKFAEKTVSDRRRETGLADRSDLLSRLMDSDKFFSDKFLKDFCISFILAGRDTSSVALTWFFWLLHTHPRVESLIVEELRRILNLSQNQRLPRDHVFTPEEMKRMEYLQAAISESLRLYPSVPIDFKEVGEDDVFPDGTRVRKGARVIYAIYSMARAESIWGDNCREFLPERWIKDGIFITESQFKYTVFNAGPRLCVGKKFAYMQMKTVAASIILRYHVGVVAGHKVSPKMTTTLYLKHGLQVTFKTRV